MPATPFLGREREVAEVRRLLRSSRLVTLTGAGGSGKTRLALQAAAEAAESFPSGVWWVPFAPLRDPALVIDSIATALGAQGDLTAHIADKELLLVLDNLEQLLPAAPELATLLESCSGLRLLVTSREPLRVAAEQEYPVLPLALRGSRRGRRPCPAAAARRAGCGRPRAQFHRGDSGSERARSRNGRRPQPPRRERPRRARSRTAAPGRNRGHSL